MNEWGLSPFVHTTGMDTRNCSTDEDLDGFNQNLLNSAEEVPAESPSLPSHSSSFKNVTIESQLCPEDLDRFLNLLFHSSTPLDDQDLLLSISCFFKKTEVTLQHFGAAKTGKVTKVSHRF